MKKLSFLLLFGLSVSCIPHKKIIEYQSKADTETLEYSFEPYKIQTGDLLSINVVSTDPASVAIFNREIGGTSMNQVTDAALYLSSYMVDKEGMINLPLVGDVTLSKLTISEAEHVLQEHLNKYYKYVSVSVKLMSFRVTVLGEVNSQGTIALYNEQTNLIQLIGLSGGITDVGNRKKVKVFRKTEGVLKSGYVDISKSDVVQSEFFIVQPNDIVYVEPLRGKAIRVNATAASLTLSSLTFLVVIINLITNL